MSKNSTASRRDFFKKSLYSAPVVLVLGHLSPSMVYGASGGLAETPQTVPTAAVEPSNSLPGAGQPSGTSNAGDGQTGSSTGVIGGSGSVGGDASTGYGDDNNQTK